MSLNRSLLLCVMLVIVVGSLVGCGSNSNVQGKIEAQNATNIQKISNAYKLYAFVNGHRGPASVDEFKQFLQTNKAIGRNLELMDIDLAKLDSYFISQADGEEFVFRWDVKLKPDLDINPIVFDKTGADGMRRVVLACDVVLEVTDDAKYERLLAGKVSKKDDVPAYVFGSGAEDNLDGQAE